MNTREIKEVYINIIVQPENCMKSKDMSKISFHFVPLYYF